MLYEVQLPSEDFGNDSWDYSMLRVLIICLVSCAYAVKNELMEAVHNADVSRVKLLLALDQDILSARPPVIIDRTDDLHNRTPLLVCGLDPQKRDRSSIDKNCLDIAKLLHKKGANMSHVDNSGWDALSMGAARGLTRFCSYLIKNHNLDIDRKDAEGRTSLMKSAFHGYFDTFAMLIRSGANTSNVQDNNGLTALHYATIYTLQNPAQIQFFSNVTSFISNYTLVGRNNRTSSHSLSADTFIDNDERTCLMYAAIGNDIAVSRRLLAIGADPRKKDKYGVTCSTMSSNEELRQLLVDAAISLTESDHERWLQSSAMRNSFTGEDLDIRDEF